MPTDEDDHHPALAPDGALCCTPLHATPTDLQRLNAGDDALPRGRLVFAEWHPPIAGGVGVQKDTVRLLDDRHVDLYPLVVRREVRLGGGR